VKSNVEPINIKKDVTCISCHFLVEPDRLYEVTLRMIVRDHEVRAFKQLRFIEPKEVYDPYDLIKRQKELMQGIEVSLPVRTSNDQGSSSNLYGVSSSSTGLN
jgi:hypothetical protein